MLFTVLKTDINVDLPETYINAKNYLKQISMLIFTGTCNRYWYDIYLR